MQIRIEEDEFGFEDSVQENGGLELQTLYWMLSEYAEKPKILILNPDRMHQVLWVKAMLEKVQADNLEIPDVRVTADGLFLGVCGLSMETYLLVLQKPEEYQALVTADNIEVVPLRNGRLQVNLTFYRVFEVGERQA